MASASSSSSSSRRPWKYDVFLSFRGVDTRNNLVSHLNVALCQRGIITFMDDEELQRGTSIGPELVAAIEDSRTAIVVLTPNYASSSWCLNELVRIMKCTEKMGQLVLPIFYHVDPSDVRHQRGSFELRPKPKVDVKDHEDVYGVGVAEEWAAALTKVANLSGFDSKNYETESKLIQEIVQQVLKNSVYTSSSADKGFIGMDSRTDDLLKNYICLDFGDVRFIGIYGMRGIGKTTVARAIYDDIFQGFDRSCFLSNVRERSKKDGLVSLQEKLLSKILMTKIENIDDEYTGAAMLERRSCKMKVLLVIDDVDQLIQLERLAGSREWFGAGSRIIITTTNIQILKAHGVDAAYKANGLNRHEALQLLSLRAFKIIPPPDDYLELCYHIIGYAQELPLAIVVLGSYLFGKTTTEWASAIERLKNTQDERITAVLRICFDGLQRKDREIFLHIACFYKGKDRDRVTRILDYCQLNPGIGLSVLADRSLISISNNKLSMHDLLQEMGWEIVRRQSRTDLGSIDLGRCSRLWSHEEIHEVLKKNKGTEAIQGMVMELPKLEVAHWNPEAFSKLSQLSLLHIDNVDLPEGLTCLSNSLRLLEWTGYPLTSLPPKFEPDELIELSLRHSKIEFLWKETKNCDKLKYITLCHSPNIVITPDLTGVQNLESLDLEGCKNLVEIHESLRFLKKLVVLNLKDCESLQSLPGKIEMECLETFILSNCSKVQKIPEFSGNMNHLLELNLDGTAIVNLPESIGCLSGLVSLNLNNCRNIVKTPDFTGVQNLQSLHLEGCKKLVSIHNSLGFLKKLTVLNLKDCESLEILPDKLEMESLQSLILSNCVKVKKIPDFVGNMERLYMLHLDETAIRELPLSIECLSGLVSLNLSNCRDLVCLPSTLNRLKSLKHLNLSGCLKLGEHHGSVEEMRSDENHLNITSVSELSSPRDLFKHAESSTSHGCGMVWASSNDLLPSELVQKVNKEPMSFHVPISGLFNLTNLNLSNCNLGDGAFANNFGYFPSLVSLNLSGNRFAHLPSGIRLLSKLQNFNLENCKSLQELSDLPSNKTLDLRADGCISLKNWFDASNLSRLDTSYFNFLNCFKLNDNQGCSNVAFDMLKRFIHQGVSDTRETFQIVIPGSVIPEWFIHQSFGKSLTVELLPGWDNSGFMGFAFCVVFVLHEHHSVDDLDVRQFKNFNATHHLVCCLELNGREVEVSGRQPAFRFSEEFCQVESDHCWLFYVSRDKYFGTEWWRNRFSQLKFIFETRGPGLIVKKCGVRLIYAEDMQELNLTNQSSITMFHNEDILGDFDKAIEGEITGTGSKTINQSRSSRFFKKFSSCFRG